MTPVHRARSVIPNGSWMVYGTVAFTWVTAVVINVTVSFPTSAVVNGYCRSWSFWPSSAVKIAYAVLYFVFYFFNLVVIFIYCYSHILLVVRRQARVMQGHQQSQQSSGGSAAAQTSSALTQSKQKFQANVTKTVITLTLFFVVCWCPNNVYYLLQNVAGVPFNYAAYYVTVFTMSCRGRVNFSRANFTSSQSRDDVHVRGWIVPTLTYVTVFMALFNTCGNPFIYASKYDILRKKLKQLLPQQIVPMPVEA